MATSTKLLGDAGEHYALSQFDFAGKYAAKMPDDWQGYDLAVETGSGLVGVIVKTRRETAGWKSSPWFSWDDRMCCEWFVFAFKPKQGAMRSWIVPANLAEAHAQKPTTGRERHMTPWARKLHWNQLNDPPLADFEDNWSLEVKALAPSTTAASC